LTINLGVEDLRDLKLRFTIYFHWWWRRLYPVQYGVGYGRCHTPNRFGTVNMEDNINIK